MKHLSDEEKYFEVRGTLEFVLRTLRSVYNEGMFNSAQKRYIFNLLKEGDISIRKVSE
jgi:hypothetical protein